jgi:hypothetical protein
LPYALLLAVSFMFGMMITDGFGGQNYSWSVPDYSLVHWQDSFGFPDPVTSQRIIHHTVIPAKAGIQLVKQIPRSGQRHV